MGTKDFNLLDKFIAAMRLRRVVMRINRGDTLLDFGCGYQAFLLRAVQNEIAMGVGIDYDAPSKVISDNVSVKNLHFKSKLPFPDASFNKITMLAVVEHIDPELSPVLFSEFKRILQPGGEIIITTPTPFGKHILEFLAFRLGIISRSEVSDHKKYYSKSDLQRLADKSGLKLRHYSTFQFGGNSLAVFG